LLLYSSQLLFDMPARLNGPWAAITLVEHHAGAGWLVLALAIKLRVSLWIRMRGEQIHFQGKIA